MSLMTVFPKRAPPLTFSRSAGTEPVPSGPCYPSTCVGVHIIVFLLIMSTILMSGQLAGKGLGTGSGRHDPLRRIQKITLTIERTFYSLRGKRCQANFLFLTSLLPPGGGG